MMTNPFGSHVTIDSIEGNSCSLPPQKKARLEDPNSHDCPATSSALPAVPHPPVPMCQQEPSDNASSLMDLYNWPAHHLKVLQNKIGPAVSTALAQTIKMTSWSTAFSGVDAPGTALRMLIAQLESSTGIPMSEPEHVHATEWLRDSQEELKVHPCSPTCIFEDIEGFFIPSVRATISKLKEKGEIINLENLLPLIQSKRAVCSEAFCIQHSRICPTRPSKVHFAGTPCVDWSPMGPQTRSSGATITTFAAWAAIRTLQEEVIIVHENSSRFDVGLLELIFGNRYTIHTTLCCPTSLGWPIRRLRRWTVLIHRVFILEVVSSLSNVLRLFERSGTCSWHVFMIADDEEKLAEL
eukprot:371600-Lingulodinium_polyedra.AAC.1